MLYTRTVSLDPVLLVLSFVPVRLPLSVGSELALLDRMEFLRKGAMMLAWCEVFEDTGAQEISRPSVLI